LSVESHFVRLETKRSTGRRSIVTRRLGRKGSESGRVGIKEGRCKSERCSGCFRSWIHIVPVDISHILIHTIHGVAQAAGVMFVYFLFQMFLARVFRRKVLLLESGDKVGRRATTRLIWSTTISGWYMNDVIYRFVNMLDI